MKINRCFYLLLLSILICFIRADCVSIAAQTDPLIQTDKKIYPVITSQDLRVVIRWTYTNRTSATVYRTRLPILIALEKKVGDKWVVALGHPPWPGPEELMSINPGGMSRGTWSIVFRRLKEVPGTYRIVLDLYGTEDGEMLQLEERVSNEFKLIENE